MNNQTGSGKKFIISIITVMSVFAIVITSIDAATYDYGTKYLNNKLKVSSYTYSSNDSCSVEVKAWYTHASGTSTLNLTRQGRYDATTRISSVVIDTPSGKPFTKATGTHKVGKNYYYSSAG